MCLPPSPCHPMDEKRQAERQARRDRKIDEMHREEMAQRSRSVIVDTRTDGERDVACSAVAAVCGLMGEILAEPIQNEDGTITVEPLYSITGCRQLPNKDGSYVEEEQEEECERRMSSLFDLRCRLPEDE